MVADFCRLEWCLEVPGSLGIFKVDSEPLFILLYVFILFLATRQVFSESVVYLMLLHFDTRFWILMRFIPDFYFNYVLYFFSFEKFRLGLCFCQFCSSLVIWVINLHIKDMPR